MALLQNKYFENKTGVKLKLKPRECQECSFRCLPWPNSHSKFPSKWELQKFQKSDFFKLPFQINLLTHRVKYLSIYYLFIIYLFIYLSSIYYLSIFYLFIIYLFNNYLQYLIIIYLFTFHSAQKIKFFIKDFCRKCDQIRSFLQIWSLLLKKSFMENFIFCVECHFTVESM